MTRRPALLRSVAALAATWLAALAVTAISPAWACMPQPLVTLQPRASGPAGSKLTVEATSVTGTSEIRWNALDGPQLAAGVGPNLSQPITIPPAPDGLYTVLVLERRPDGSVGSTGRAAFLIGAAPAGTGAGSGGAGINPTSTRRSSPLGYPLVAAGGLGLVALGAAGGAVAARRRSAGPSSSAGAT